MSRTRVAYEGNAYCSVAKQKVTVVKEERINDYGKISSKKIKVLCPFFKRTYWLEKPICQVHECECGFGNDAD